LVSVILPYFNAEKSLSRAIKSILDQSYGKIELLLVNNNSTDNSLQIATRFEKIDQRIRLFTETKQGVVHAANLGIQNSSGKFIARMDADDFAYPARIEKQVDHLTNNPDISISATQVRFISENNEEQGFEHFVKWSNELLNHSDILQNRFVEFPVVNPTLMVRRTIFEKIGCFKEGDFPEDYEWFLRAMKAGCSIDKLDKPLLDWQDSETRLTRVDSRYRSDAFYKIKTHYLANHLKNKLGTRPKVWIWGAGKLGYQRSQWLLDYSVNIVGYIDIKKNKSLEKYPCTHFEYVTLEQQPFIISYISNRGRRDEVRSFLNSQGYQEGINYIVAG
jgi:glycosyltransferase involved in cell wall biosynthesis